MSRLIRTVSLDRESDERAAEKPNFSGWVREQLKKEDRVTTRMHPTQAIFNEKGICNPNASPRCGLCYPYGKPSMASIRAYNGGVITKEDMIAVSKELYEASPRVESVIESKDEPFTPVLRERKYLRRSLKWLWNFI